MGEKILLLILISIFNLDLACCRKLYVRLRESWDLFPALQQNCHHGQTSLLNPPFSLSGEMRINYFLFRRTGSVDEELIRDLTVVCQGRERWVRFQSAGLEHPLLCPHLLVAQLLGDVCRAPFC